MLRRSAASSFPRERCAATCRTRSATPPSMIVQTITSLDSRETARVLHARTRSIVSTRTACLHGIPILSRFGGPVLELDASYTVQSALACLLRACAIDSSKYPGSQLSGDSRGHSVDMYSGTYDIRWSDLDA